MPSQPANYTHLVIGANRRDLDRVIAEIVASDPQARPFAATRVVDLRGVRFERNANVVWTELARWSLTTAVALEWELVIDGRMAINQLRGTVLNLTDLYNDVNRASLPSRPGTNTNLTAQCLAFIDTNQRRFRCRMPRGHYRTRVISDEITPNSHITSLEDSPHLTDPLESTTTHQYTAWYDTVENCGYLSESQLRELDTPEAAENHYTRALRSELSQLLQRMARYEAARDSHQAGNTLWFTYNPSRVRPAEVYVVINDTQDDEEDRTLFLYRWNEERNMFVFDPETLVDIRLRQNNTTEPSTPPQSRSGRGTSRSRPSIDSEW